MPPSSPSVFTPQQEQPQRSFSSSPSSTSASPSIGTWRMCKKHPQLQRESNFPQERPVGVSDKDSILPPFVSRDKQTVFPKTANPSFMNPRACVPPVRDDKRSVHFENNYTSLGSKDCATFVPPEPSGVKTVSSETALHSNARSIKDSICFAPSKPKFISTDSVYRDPGNFVSVTSQPVVLSPAQSSVHPLVHSSVQSLAAPPILPLPPPVFRARSAQPSKDHCF